MGSHRQFNKTLCTEPKDDEFLGSFLHIESTVEEKKFVDLIWRGKKNLT